MNAKQARLLLPGSVVMWDGNPQNTGTVRNIDASGVWIDWKSGARGWIEHRDCAAVSNYEPAKDTKS